MDEAVQTLQYKLKDIEEEIRLEVRKYNQVLETLKGRRESLDALIAKNDSIQSAINKIKE